MIIFGWGKKAKEIAYLGIHKCSNCKNYCRFDLYELANRISLYFIPVAKWGKKSYRVCSTCETGFEVAQPEKTELLRVSINLPAAEDVAAVWDSLMTIDRIVHDDERILNGARPDTDDVCEMWDSFTLTDRTVCEDFRPLKSADLKTEGGLKLRNIYRRTYTEAVVDYALHCYAAYLDDDDVPK